MESGVFCFLFDMYASDVLFCPPFILTKACLYFLITRFRILQDITHIIPYGNNLYYLTQIGSFYRQKMLEPVTVREKGEIPESLSGLNMKSSLQYKYLEQIVIK